MAYDPAKRREWYERRKARAAADPGFAERERELKLARQARYRESHRETLRAAGREYMNHRYATDPEFAERARERSRSVDPDVRRERRRASYARNPERGRERSRAYRKANPDKVREALRDWYRRHPEVVAQRNALRRARTEGTAAERFAPSEIYERDGGRCHICKRPVSASRFHLDHLIPLSLGGPHTRENVAIAHPRCNIKRGAGKLPAQLRM